MPVVEDNFQRFDKTGTLQDQTPLSSPWTNVTGGGGTAQPMCLHNGGFAPPGSTVQGGGSNGGANGGISVRLGDGIYQPNQNAQATIKTIAGPLATMKITAASFSSPNATYAYSNYVGNGDAASGIFTNMDIVVAGMQNAGNNGDFAVTSSTGGPSSGTFTVANGSGVTESGSNGTRFISAELPFRALVSWLTSGIRKEMTNASTAKVLTR